MFEIYFRKRNNELKLRFGEGTVVAESVPRVWIRGNASETEGNKRKVKIPLAIRAQFNHLNQQCLALAL